VSRDPRSGPLALGFDAVPSAANWLLIRDRPDLWRTLAPAGVLVRDCTNFGLPGVSRVALRTAGDLDLVVAAFDQAAQ